MMAKRSAIQRHARSDEYTIVPANKQALTGWQNLKATQANLLAIAWDFLATTPTQTLPEANYRLKGSLGLVSVQGQSHEVWQYKKLSGGARIWFYVVEEERTVYLLDVATRHPNQTK